MPELPEVETLCRQLREVVIGGELQEATVRDAKLGEPPALKGSIIRSVARHGKCIHVHLHDGRTLRLHLRMTGRLLWQEGARRSPAPDHSRMTFIFSKGRLDLIDPRRFATVQVIAGAMDDPGPPDPLEDFNIERLRKIAAARTIPSTAVARLLSMVVLRHLLFVRLVLPWPRSEAARRTRGSTP